MKRNVNSIFAAALMLAVAGPAFADSVDPKDGPYGSAKFAPYADIDSIKQLKVVWDFNFVDPKAVGLAFNNVNALLRATAELAPTRSIPSKW